MLTTLKPQVERALQPLAKLLRNIHPNTISLSGLIFPVIFFWCVAQGYYLAALGVFIFNGMDLLDGMVARSQNKVSAFGGFLDSTIDRFADFVILTVFGFTAITPWTVILPLLLFTYLTSYIRSRTELAAKGQLTASVGLIERTERLLVIFFGLMLYAIFPSAELYGQNIMTITLIGLTALSAVTVGQRIAFAYKHLR